MTNNSASGIDTVVEPPPFQASPPRWLRPARDWVCQRPGGTLIWKALIGVVGAAIVVLGLLLIPLPGPGWAIVFLGLAVWATEFARAQRLLRFGQRVLRQWTAWARRQSLFVRGLLGLAGLLVLAALAYLGWRFLW
ncbi:MAG: TIGR02611 family protein [Actinomycetota bacterium]|nr:TIGR02611 family protein [Actinomycetota bacterium]MDQ2959048.1 TIGR02611 family protein [Actinomycetota bacterium]